MKRHDFQNHIAKKAWTDPDFKQRLLANPRAVISDELSQIKEGVSIPENVKVTVLEEKPDQIYMVLPVNPGDVTGKPLTEEDLEKIAGGESAATSAVTTAAYLDVVQVVQGVLDNGVVVATISGSDPVSQVTATVS